MSKVSAATVDRLSDGGEGVFISTQHTTKTVNHTVLQSAMLTSSSGEESEHDD